ncbi:MAG: M20 metallopeptidase family protein [Advenella sp.]
MTASHITWQLPTVLSERLIELRRDLHQHPELAFREERTANRIAQFLRNLGLDPKCQVAGTGVVAVLDTGRPGRTVGIRVDMDALPMEETSDVPFRSTHPGVAHTCGHDVHSSIGVGAAAMLVRHVAALSGRYKFIFQPAEETLEGAKAMIEAGALVSPDVDVLLGCHNSPQQPAGTVAWRSGPSMASSSAFSLHVRGAAGHAAHPTSGIDALQAVPALLSGLSAIRCKEVPANEPVVLTVGRIVGGRARNIVCDEVLLEGTCRTLGDAVVDVMEAAVRRLAQGVALATRTTIDIQWNRLAPVLVNSPDQVKMVVAALRDSLGTESVLELESPSMGSEDFAWYVGYVPLVHLRIGGRAADRTPTQLHQSNYFCDEAAVEIGAIAMASAAAALARDKKC